MVYSDYVSNFGKAGLKMARKIMAWLRHELVHAGNELAITKLNSKETVFGFISDMKAINCSQSLSTLTKSL